MMLIDAKQLQACNAWRLSGPPGAGGEDRKCSGSTGWFDRTVEVQASSRLPESSRILQTVTVNQWWDDSEHVLKGVLSYKGAFQSILQQQSDLLLAQVNRQLLKHRVFYWVCLNRGADDEDVATQFDISLSEAADVIDDLLSEGLLQFDD